MRLTLLDLLEATGGGEVGGTQVGERYATYHTDSREVQPGGVFFALRGAEKDGHQFVRDAINRGAAAVVVERRLEAPAGIVEIVVPDSWKALYDVAFLVLSRVNPLVVGITGSNGKTSTKEMTAAVLATKFETLHSAGNLNTETGVPLTIMRLDPNHAALVVEMGLQRAGDIARLVALARPRIGVVTNVGAVHMEFFATQEDLARAKGELVAGLPENGHAVLNADDRYFPVLSSLSAAPVSTFGAAGGDFRVSAYRPTAGGGCHFTVRSVEVGLAMSGRHQALNAAAALAVGEAAGVPLNEGGPALAGVAVEHRLQEFTTPVGFIVVDDAYNASPESMLAAFATMEERPRDGRLLAVLGHMGELGDSAGDAHRHVGEVAARTFDRIAVIDTPLGRVLAEAARADIVPDNAAAIAWVREHAREGDRVLVKGSHSRRLEEVVAGLTAS
ncbi:MAG TPA: UDP-N-acetylmuramoyl-tripeptide--D-alanyl-D-alanine ligase [Candidatus Dormibacteraeota bacterium]|nr:UDP-N-acetylmuramoyl-tripeptide--D-alanyl-D-alanine ligase [Candidatus Dormibacteraeota bacterium]